MVKEVKAAAKEAVKVYKSLDKMEPLKISKDMSKKEKFLRTGFNMGHPLVAVKTIGGSIKDSFEKDVIHGNDYSRAYWGTKATLNTATAVVGTKGVGSLRIIGKNSKGVDVQRINSNIEESKLARESSNFGEYLKKEKKILDKIDKRPSKAEQFDFKSWEEMPVSGQIRIAPNGQRLMSVRELKTFKSEMSANNIKVVIDKKGNILPSNAAAGFNPELGQIVLRREPTALSALHESYHAQQWRQLGKENYLKQSTLEREEYVYNEIMRKKDKFSEEEILFSQRYIYKLRSGNWPPQDWKGFEE
ncbi:zincin-like metallopeptidase toxin domain-containing protein [Lysinibacillus fusiformis]|uniref:zincin-like metallopeptidase toxin domain-containing protein n=1 Tax=Lysinibacillus fusiformis TaxID=28031 RepID=UPI003D0467A3